MDESIRWKELAWSIHQQVVSHAMMPGSLEDIRFLSLAMAGEVGEYCNLIKKQWRSGERRVNTKDIRLELADIRIYLELVSRCLLIDLDDACYDKLRMLGKKFGPEVAVLIKEDELALKGLDCACCHLHPRRKGAHFYHSAVTSGKRPGGKPTSQELKKLNSRESRKNGKTAPVTSPSKKKPS